MVVQGIATSGSGSLRIRASFAQGSWSAALVEIQRYMDLSAYESIACDILVPPDAPRGLRARLILTVGDEWRFVEMSRSFRLVPGVWTTVQADISPESRDWKRTTLDEAFRSDIRKIAVRIESNRDGFSGDIYVDHFRASAP